MRTRLTPLACLLVLGSAGFVTLSLTRGQEARPAPALPPQPIPTGPVVTPAGKPLRVTPPRSLPAAARKAACKVGRDLSKLTPLQRQFHDSARNGANWLSRMNATKGRFVPGLLPALYAPLESDRPLRQTGAAFALARAARYFQDPDEAARATQAILTLLEDTAVDPKKPHIRRSTLSPQVANPLARAALLVLAIGELPAPEEELLNAAEQLCNYLRLQQQPDGSLNTGAVAGRAGAEDPELLTYPGMALCALMRSQTQRPAKWKTDVVRKALPFYLKAWRGHKDRDFVCWQSAAYAEAFLRTKEKPFAEAVFEMNDWLCGLQYERLDPRHPRWLGGFMTCLNGKVVGEAPDIWSALCASSLVEACRVTRQLPDLSRHERYADALESCLRFLTTLQFSEADTQHFADWYRRRLVGGFHASHQDGNLRIDYTHHALAAQVQYLLYNVPAQ